MEIKISSLTGGLKSLEEFLRLTSRITEFNNKVLDESA